MNRLVEAAAEIARRRRLATAVLHFDSPWYAHDLSVGYGTAHPLAGLICRTADYGTQRLPEFIASNDPEHTIAVLDQALRTLERHCFDDGFCAHCGNPVDEDMTGCDDAQAVLDLYAPLPAVVR